VGLSTTSLEPTLALLVTRVQPESILHVRLRPLFQSHAQIALGSVTENRHSILLAETIQSTGIRRAGAPKIPGTEVAVCLNPLHPIVGPPLLNRACADGISRLWRPLRAPSVPVDLFGVAPIVPFGGVPRAVDGLELGCH